MAASDDDRVELTELDVITRFSLAVRTATADRAELIAALRDDLAWLEAGRSGRRATGSSARAVKKATPARSSTTGTAAKKATSSRSRSTRSR
jgi:hypothetical protein